MSSTELIRLEIPRSPMFVILARKAVGCIGQRLQLTDEERADLKLAVGEACSNSVKFSDPESESVTVLCRISPEKLEIEVRNKGAFIPPNTDFEPLREGGMGLSLIEQLMDEMHIDSAHGETSLRMVKNLRS